MAAVNAGIQHTLPQVARALDLSEGATSRLAALFNMPRRHYRPGFGQPRLFLFGQDESAFLLDAQARLLNGEPLAELKLDWQAREARRPDALATFVNSDNEDTLTQVPEYVAQDTMSAQWARDTFDQYRRQTDRRTPPLKALVSRLERTSATPPKSVSRPLAQPRDIPTFDTSWMTDEFTRRAYALQAEILGHRH